MDTKYHFSVSAKVLKERREKYIHFPDRVIMGVGETIFETPLSGPWTLDSHRQCPVGSIFDSSNSYVAGKSSIRHRAE